MYQAAVGWPEVVAYMINWHANCCISRWDRRLFKFIYKLALLLTRSIKQVMLTTSVIQHLDCMCHADEVRHNIIQHLT